MATEEDTTTGHPVPAGLRALSASVTALAERPLFALDAATTRDTIVALAEVKSRLAAYEYAVLAHAEEVKVGADTGCTSTGVWAANATRSRKNVTAAQVRLATALERAPAKGDPIALDLRGVGAAIRRHLADRLHTLGDHK